MGYLGCPKSAGGGSAEMSELGMLGLNEAEAGVGADVTYGAEVLWTVYWPDR